MTDSTRFHGCVHSKRLEKHLKIKTLAEAKLNSISNYVSVALTDEYVSADDYSLILSEFNKFNVMKEAVRCKRKAAEDEDLKKKEHVEKDLK